MNREFYRAVYSTLIVVGGGVALGYVNRLLIFHDESRPMAILGFGSLAAGLLLYQLGNRSEV